MKTRVRCHFTSTILMDNNKCYRECGEIGALIHCWWNCEIVQPFWKTVWQSFQRLNIELPYGPVGISTPRYIPKRKENLCPHRNLYMIVHRSIIHNSQKVKIIQMSINWWMNKKIWYIHTIKYYLAKRNEISTLATTWVNFKNFMLSERS